jgi:hypothetical protein
MNTHVHGVGSCAHGELACVDCRHERHQEALRALIDLFRGSVSTSLTASVVPTKDNPDQAPDLDWLLRPGIQVLAATQQALSHYVAEDPEERMEIVTRIERTNPALAALLNEPENEVRGTDHVLGGDDYFQGWAFGHLSGLLWTLGCQLNVLEGDESDIT